MSIFKRELDDILLLIKDLTDALGSDWMIIGGIAIASAGEPRNTKDVDFSIGTTVDKAGEVDRFLISRGWNKIEGPGQIKDTGIWLSRYANKDESRHLTLDVFYTMSEWQRIALSRRMKVTFMGSSYWVATPEDLILFKMIANRSRDIGDIDGILDLRMSTLDTPYIESWTEELRTRDRWVNALTRYHDRRML